MKKLLDSLLNIKDSPVYDWGILIGTVLTPIFVAGLGFWLNIQQDARDEVKKNHEIMTSYLDSMTNLILEKNLGKPSEKEGARTVARAITLNTARRLNGESRGQLLKFLYEAKLVGECKAPGYATKNIDRKKYCKDKIVDMQAARLDGAILGDTPMPPLKGVVLDKANLNGANLPNIILPYASLAPVRLAGANLTGADLTGVTASKPVVLSKAYLQNAYLTKATLQSAQMDAAHLQCATLNEIDLKGAKLRGANLSNSNLERATLGLINGKKIDDNKTDLTGAILRGAILTGVNFSNVILKDADLTGAIYDKKTILPKGFTERFDMKFKPDGSDYKAVLAEKKKRCDALPIEDWHQNQDQNGESSSAMEPPLFRRFTMRQDS